MPVVVIHADKQPSVAITIQTEYSYFSAIHLSFLTHGNQSDCSQCFTHCSYALAFWVNYWSMWSGSPGEQSFCVRHRVVGACSLIQVELLVAVLQKHCAGLWSASTWKHLSGSSPTLHGKTSQAHTGSVIRDSFGIDRFLCQRRDNIICCGVFLLNSSFLYFRVCCFYSNCSRWLLVDPNRAKRKCRNLFDSIGLYL